jgi:hypothetical protein
MAGWPIALVRWHERALPHPAIVRGRELFVLVSWLQVLASCRCQHAVPEWS